MIKTYWLILCARSADYGGRPNVLWAGRPALHTFVSFVQNSLRAKCALIQALHQILVLYTPHFYRYKLNVVFIRAASRWPPGRSRWGGASVAWRSAARCRFLCGVLSCIWTAYGQNVRMSLILPLEQPDQIGNNCRILCKWFSMCDSSFTGLYLTLILTL